METVREFRKLLDLNLSELIENLELRDDGNLEKINRNSTRINNIIQSYLQCDAFNTKFDQDESDWDRLDSCNDAVGWKADAFSRRKLSNQIPSMILRNDSSRSPSRSQSTNATDSKVRVKRNFLRKGDGLKRFNLDSRTNPIKSMPNENSTKFKENDRKFTDQNGPINRLRFESLQKNSKNAKAEINLERSRNTRKNRAKELDYSEESQNNDIYDQKMYDCSDEDNIINEENQSVSKKLHPNRSDDEECDVDEEDDEIVLETTRQIKILEDRINNLLSLKLMINQFTDFGQRNDRSLRKQHRDINDNEHHQCGDLVDENCDILKVLQNVERKLDDLNHRFLSRSSSSDEKKIDSMAEKIDSNEIKAKSMNSKV
ncbi:hypothetical protein QR98_0076330 [Sarcoptes scabiei]|uniref:CENPJ tubulin-binding region domain-containing protein n=1 Tax=Sarcoptes scabiei TaxID=52283 RepID=A0A132ADP8_SARSC|nr:hypothetical protein QR98_0076330 [Sarcoptes scabiei]